MFLLREVETRDLEDLYQLAGAASFINLPRDKALLTKKISRSIASFKSRQVRHAQDEYVFVLEDRKKQKVVGTSMILGQHGTPDEPHTYFEVLPKKKISKSLHMGFLHQVLRLGFDYNGPTEIGGLVILPEYRGHPEKLGKILSFVRFAYIAARRPQFREEILSELMPPFNDRGESPIWEEIGRKFTNLRYDEADRLSRRNKEFITSLFPEGDIYTCMLSSEAREAIGQVGADTAPVKKMLENIGFKYRNMIDPFDGGPHYWAQTSQVDPVRKTKRVRVAPKREAKTSYSTQSGLVMVFTKKGIRAAVADFQVRGASELILTKEVQDELGADENTEAYFLPLKI